MATTNPAVCNFRGLGPKATDTKIMHALYRLADYPLLATLALERTQATKLDGRACWSIYEGALARIDWQTISASELAFIRSLGIER